jgi:hypothetical protein
MIGRLVSKFRRRFGHARGPSTLKASELEALAWAATQKGAWSSSRLSNMPALDVLVARDLVHACASLPDGTRLYKITSAGRALVDAHGPRHEPEEAA